eukprot:6663091-Heterocapsa_arctica.AAC.1
MLHGRLHLHLQNALTGAPVMELDMAHTYQTTVMAVKAMVPGYPYLQLMYNGILLEDAHPLDYYN